MPSLTPLPDMVDRRLLRGRRILLVEDSADTREASKRIFQRRACEVTTAASGEEALEHGQARAAGNHHFRSRPAGHFGHRIHDSSCASMPEWRDVVAVALSGLGREQDIKAAAEAGFDAHLLKPVDMAVLDQTLAEALQKRIDAKEA